MTLPPIPSETVAFQTASQDNSFLRLPFQVFYLSDENCNLDVPPKEIRVYWVLAEILIANSNRREDGLEHASVLIHFAS